MAVDSITTAHISHVRALIITAVIAALLLVAFLTKPEDGYNETFWSLVPAVLAIALALITKEVYSSLFIGILFGAMLYAEFNFEKVLTTVVDDGFLTVLTDSWNVGILMFLVILGIIGVLVLKSGGTKAYAEWAMTHIKSRPMAELATWALGVLIFVDDYFNCLTVGQVMRSLTDKFKVSRAKLAYLIDATAAPICIIAPISSWAAAVSGSLRDGQIEEMGMNGFEAFLRTIPFNFYALFSIVMIVTIVLLKFDFGPMKRHEDNALKGDLFSTDDRPFEGVKEEKINENGHILDLVIPIIVFLIPSCIICLVYTGGAFAGVSFIDAFADCDASLGLTYGSLIGLLLTIVYMVARKAATFQSILDALPAGFRNMVPPILILVFAWTLSTTTEDYLQAAANVDSLLGDADNLANFLPAIFMLLACFIAFATGTSWGTMGILLPIVVATFHTSDTSLMIVGISACLAGSVFGDHISPISDTTIMSSAGAQCSHVVHVSTQIPYAVLVAGMSFIFYIIAGFWQSYIVTVIGIVAMVAVLFGMKKLQDAGKLGFLEHKPKVDKTE
jgi:Na+/H+ antiporter NhaC